MCRISNTIFIKISYLLLITNKIELELCLLFFLQQTLKVVLPGENRGSSPGLDSASL